MKNIILYGSLLVLALTSCMDEEVPSAALNVTLDKTEYQVGEAVTFKLNGNPDNIVFYSGENGHNYEMRNRQYADNDLLVNFKTYVRYGEIYKNLQFLVSTNFSGVYDQENVKAADWVDLSDQFTFSSGADQVPSGEVNLKECAGDDPNAQIYMAFRYTDVQKARQNNWIIRSITLDQVSPEGVKTGLAAMSTMGWKAVDILNPKTVWNIATAQILIDGGANQPDNEDWVISKPFKAKEAVADTGVALKNISTTLNEYTYVYTKPGTYKVVFETTSDWYSGSNYSLTEVIVEVK